MVRKYLRQTSRQDWSLESMEDAVNAVIEGHMGSFSAARQFSVPQATTERHVAKKRANPGYTVVKRLGPITSVFTSEQEAELKDYLTQMEGQYFGLTLKELCELASQLAERNNIKHPFNTAYENQRPHQSHEHWESQLDTFKFTGDRIFNCDETGLTVIPKGRTKVVALKGRRQLGAVTSAERGQTVTAKIGVSASGLYVPAMLIYPRKRMQQAFATGLPPGAWAEVQETGWMTKELFLTWFKKFIVFTGASKERPILLLLDGHKTHTKNLELINVARENGVVLLCLPPHCSHRLQPLHVAFMKPLSKFYEDEVTSWLRTHPGEVVTLHQIASLFGKAFIHSATMSTAVNGFRKTGIWPVNRNVFQESDYLPCSTTDIHQAHTSGVTETEDQIPEMLSRCKTPEQLTTDDQPSVSSNFQVTSPEMVLDIPKVDKKKPK
ncbi:uncharacterized protein LOC126176141 [Schistocerca cancellata]|uniref:uncharacterized protein LOC126176141 n=1 Tax=Schistocerca cancellata TaxID=274614 RepID=UPI002118E102|nr:uncharacterized protein LOC126176141 [Schistocerca cancellata]